MPSSVAVWKNSWLPYSETFIVDQLTMLDHTDTLRLGYHNLPDGLMAADYAPYPNTRAAKAARVALGTAPFLGSYERLCRKHGVGLIHAHFGVGGLAIQSLSDRLDVPILTTFHGADHTFGRGTSASSRASYAQRLQKLHSGRGYALAVSEYVRDRLIENGVPASRVRVHYTGTRPVELREPPSREGIVFVGRLIDIKGCRDLLQAVALLPGDLRKSRVTIVGDGPLRQSLESFSIAEGLNTAFLGRLPADEIPAVLAAHSIFCGPSKASNLGTREGFGMTFVEASMQALPVVAYASGGVSEAVADAQTGLLADEGDVQGLSSRLLQLLREPAQAQAFGQAGRARAERLFDVTENTAVLEQIYAELMLGEWSS